MFTGLNAKTHFGRPHFEKILKQVSDKHLGVSNKPPFRQARPGPSQGFVSKIRIFPRATNSRSVTGFPVPLPDIREQRIIVQVTELSGKYDKTLGVRQGKEDVEQKKNWVGPSKLLTFGLGFHGQNPEPTMVIRSLH